MHKKTIVFFYDCFWGDLLVATGVFYTVFLIIQNRLAHMDDTDRSFLEDLLPWSPKLPEYIRKQKDR